jgi:hypothetical protein
MVDDNTTVQRYHILFFTQEGSNTAVGRNQKKLREQRQCDIGRQLPSRCSTESTRDDSTALCLYQFHD